MSKRIKITAAIVLLSLIAISSAQAFPHGGAGSVVVIAFLTNDSGSVTLTDDTGTITLLAQ